MRVRIALIAAFLLAACSGERRALPHDAYVWQRRWDASLVAALAESRTFVGRLRVLALQRDAQARWIDAGVDLAVLAADARGVVATVRLDGRLAPGDDAATRIAALAQRWRDAGVALHGVEIDHDCATAQLDGYAQWLRALRGVLPRDTRLSVTALPDWRASPALDALFDAVDETVLQVHAVQDPARGLFDRALAQRWIDAWAQRSTKPFRVALPAYGAALRLDADGGVLAVESEQPLAGAAADVREIEADPRDVAALLRALEARPPARLDGIVWFRLPRVGDRRAWSLATLRAVATAQPLHAALKIALRASTDGAFDLVANNAGVLDAALPSTLRIDAPCATGDGLAGYRYEPGARVQFFRRDARATLRAGSERVLGWLRCDLKEPGNVAVVAE